MWEALGSIPMPNKKNQQNNKKFLKAEQQISKWKDLNTTREMQIKPTMATLRKQAIARVGVLARAWRTVGPLRAGAHMK